MGQHGWAPLAHLLPLPLPPPSQRRGRRGQWVAARRSPLFCCRESNTLLAPPGLLAANRAKPNGVHPRFAPRGAQGWPRGECLPLHPDIHTEYRVSSLASARHLSPSSAAPTTPSQAILPPSHRPSRVNSRVQTASDTLPCRVCCTYTRRHRFHHHHPASTSILSTPSSLTPI